MYNQIDSNKRKTWLLMTVFFVVIVMLGWIFGEAYDFGYGGLILAALLAVIINLVSFFNGDKVALAMSGDALYSLDAAQGRVVRHAIGRPSDVKALWPSPGPAPAVLAHDGKNLWSYDAVTRTFYRHLTEGADAVAENFRAELEVVPTAMAWRDGELWVYDSKGKQMVVFGLRGHALEPRKAAAFPAPALSLTMVFAPSDKGRSALELWALSPAGADSPAPTLRRFRARR